MTLGVDHIKYKNFRPLENIVLFPIVAKEYNFFELFQTANTFDEVIEKLNAILLKPMSENRKVLLNNFLQAIQQVQSNIRSSESLFPASYSADLKEYFLPIIQALQRLLQQQVSTPLIAPVADPDIHNKITSSIKRRKTEPIDTKEVMRSTDVVAIGDLHGDLQALYNTLMAYGLIDGLIYDEWKWKWIGGDTKVVLLGDYFDKGDQGKEIIEKIEYLREKGADIEMMTGNHEDLILRAAFDPDLESLMWWIINLPGEDFPEFCNIGMKLRKYISLQVIIYRRY